MYGNFIYFVIGLLIYTTYQSPKHSNYGPIESFLIFILVFIGFASIVFFAFKKLEKTIEKPELSYNYDRFDSLHIKLQFLAVLCFTYNIYGLNLKNFLEIFSIFKTFPSLLSFIFLIIYTFYFAIICYFSHGPYEKLYNENTNRSEYVYSNISFSIPVLIPWIFISAFLDIIELLPFDYPKQLINSSGGDIIFFPIFLITIAVFAPVIVQKFWRCSSLENGFYRSRIEKICENANLKYADILRWPIMGGKMITAGVMGLVSKFRYILVTNALLEALSPEELDSVIAHEIGHIKKKHLLLYLIFFAGFILFSYSIFDLIRYFIFYSYFLLKLIESSGENISTVFSIVFTIIMIIIFIIYFRFLFGFFMRNFERQADLYVFSIIGHASFLISSLEKITFFSGRPPDRPNWHHYSIKERIDYLEKCQQDSIWIDKHEKKLKISIIAYLIGILILSILTYYIHYSFIQKKLTKEFHIEYTQRLIEDEIKKTPDDPTLYKLLGKVCLERKKFKKALISYHKSNALKPNDPEILNDIAWIYATCENHILRDYQKALEFALQAYNLSQSPHIIDTLAESYYVNGNFEKALELEKGIMTMKVDDKSYYMKQIEKFEKALKNN